MSASAAAAAAIAPVDPIVYVRPMRGKRNPNDPAFKDMPGECIVNVCSTGRAPFSTTLSPFFVGPCSPPLSSSGLGHGVSKNMENAWQYSKVYKCHVDSNTGEPTAEWYKWAGLGFANEKAVRFPMGRGAKPEYSFGGVNDDGTVKRLDYVEARFRIYAPLYAELVVQSAGVRALRHILSTHGKITLLDFDGWNHRAKGLSLEQVMYHPGHKCGHGFILAMILMYDHVWCAPFRGQNGINDAVQTQLCFLAGTPRLPFSLKRPAEDTAHGDAERGASRQRAPQPPPVNKGTPVPPAFQAWAREKNFVVAAELSKSRSDFGIEKYGQPLMTQDGRDSVEDAIDEIGDFFHYTQKAIMNGEDLSRLVEFVVIAQELLGDAVQSRR